MKELYEDQKIKMQVYEYKEHCKEIMRMVDISYCSNSQGEKSKSNLG